MKPTPVIVLLAGLLVESQRGFGVTGRGEKGANMPCSLVTLLDDQTTKDRVNNNPLKVS